MFVLKDENLLLGDIILTAQHALVSKAIRFGTSSEFSHAMLYVADYSYIHSDADGVHSGNTQRLLFTEEGHASVLRLRTPDPDAVANACIFARSEVGKQYSVPEALKSPSRRAGSKRDSSNRQFCSRLVAQAYASAGVPLVTNADYCYPGDFTSSPLLHTVANALRQATSDEILLAESDSLIDLQTVTTNSILQQVRQLSGLDIQSFEQLVSFLIESPQHDHAVCEIVKKSDYLHLWKKDVLCNPWRYDSAEFARLPVSDSERVDAARKELDSCSEISII